MKLYLLALCAGIPALSMADFNVSVNKGDITISGAGSAGYRLLPNGHTKYVVNGSAGKPVHVIGISQGIDFTANRSMTIETAPDPSAKGKTMILSAAGDGGIRFVRTLRAETAEVTCPAADYSATASTGTLDLRGATKIVTTNSASKRVVTATGTGGSATLDPKVQGEGALQRATLNGPVKIVAKLVQPKEGGGTIASTYIATGDRLVVVKDTTPGTATLTGNVVVDQTSEDPSGGTVHADGLNKVVLTLNEKNEVVEINGDGAPTRTIFHPGKKGGVIRRGTAGTTA